MFLLICSFVLISGLGYLAQTTGLCLVRGVNEASLGKPLFLIGILISGVLSWVTAIGSNFFGIPFPFISYELSLWAVVGGILFGLGAAFNNGCGVSTISRLARGHLHMFVTICGWVLGWIILIRFVPSPGIDTFVITSSLHYGMLALATMIIVLIMIGLGSADRKHWVGMLMIGLMASLVFLAEPHWTPSSLLKDISFSFWSVDNSEWPSVYRFGLVTALIGGMLIAALRTKSFHLLPLNLKGCAKHLAAGTLMGIGAAIASGGNDSQLLLALPSLSPAGFATVFCMLFGIFIGRKLIQRQ